MAKQKARRTTQTALPTPFEQARDELFQHIMRCGVIESAGEHQTEWFDETLVYFGERFPELTSQELAELRTLGERFAQPPRAQVTADASAA